MHEAIETVIKTLDSQRVLLIGSGERPREGESSWERMDPREASAEAGANLDGYDLIVIEDLHEIEGSIEPSGQAQVLQKCADTLTLFMSESRDEDMCFEAGFSLVASPETDDGLVLHICYP